jgi:hypothetical protein
METPGRSSSDIYQPILGVEVTEAGLRNRAASAPTLTEPLPGITRLKKHSLPPETPVGPYCP